MRIRILIWLKFTRYFIFQNNVFFDGENINVATIKLVFFFFKAYFPPRRSVFLTTELHFKKQQTCKTNYNRVFTETNDKSFYKLAFETEI